MIDYTKVTLPAHHRTALSEQLDFRRPVNEDTGEVATGRSRVAQFGPALQRRCGTITEADPLRRAMQFHQTPTGRLLLDGSWHKQAQNGANHGAFTLPQFTAAVAELCAPFGLDPSVLDLQVLEAGVNIIPPIGTKEVISRLVCHREGIPFSRMRAKRGRSLGVELVRSEYTLKIYDKGAQYGLPHPLLRVEVKFTKSRQFRRLGIHTLADLHRAEHWQALAAALLALFDEIIVEEPHLDLDALSIPERKLAERAGDYRYWANLSDKDRHRARLRYHRMVTEHAQPSLKAQLRETIASACIALRETPSAQTGEVLTGSAVSESGEVLTASPSGKGGEVSTACATSENGEVLTVIRDTPLPNEMEEYHPSVMGEDLPRGPTEEEVRRCLICGRDISHQHSSSKVCSEWRYGRDGKRCRNALSNWTRDRHRIEGRGPLLFDHSGYLRPHRLPNHRNRSAA